MYEENRRFSWTNLFIRVIIVIIFVLFTVWLLSLSNANLSNSLDVLTDNIFSENIEKMKEVGKEYFTTERLPKKTGDIKTLTLSKMYDEKLILELKDKNGKACSAKDSYVSVEKLENEYQMKVYLECGNESDYIVVIMGCYDYCENDICEVKEPEEIKNLEYQYSKTTGGKWSDWGKWTEWSKTSVTEKNYRDVETKVVDEKYTYEKDVTKTIYTQDATCPTVAGYKLVSNKNGKCTYEMTNSNYANPVCPTLSGYTFTGRNGFTCSYNKTTTSYAKPICPTVSGYTFTGINGLTCNYSKTTTSKTDYELVYYSAGSGSYVPADNDTYDYVMTSSDYTYNCNGGCGFKWYYTYNIYKKDYKSTTETTTRSASCPSGYTKLENTCVDYNTVTETKTASCPSGYTKSGNTCVDYNTVTDSRNATCPTGEYIKMENVIKMLQQQKKLKGLKR